MIFLDKLGHIDAAIKNKLFAKFFDRDEIGQTCLFAFEESKRMLAVYASARVLLLFQIYFSDTNQGSLDAAPCLRI